MLNRLKVSNWHCFDEIEIELRKVTLLMGKSYSGKSSLLHTLQYLRWINGIHDTDMTRFYHYKKHSKILGQATIIKVNNFKLTCYQEEYKPSIDETHFFKEDDFCKRFKFCKDESTFEPGSMKDDLLNIIVSTHPACNKDPLIQTHFSKEIAGALKQKEYSNKQHIIETHSNYIVDGFRIAIVDGFLNHEDFIINYINKDGSVNKITVNKYGAFASGDTKPLYVDLENATHIMKKAMELRKTERKIKDGDKGV